MAKWRYYILPVSSGDVIGTNDSEVADSWVRDSEENIVIDSETNTYQEGESIPEAGLLDNEEEAEEGDEDAE